LAFKVIEGFLLLWALLKPNR